MLGTIALAIVAFASTNIDDTFVLIGFFSNRALSRIAIIAGQYVGIATLTAGSIVCAMLTVAIPDQYMRFLGVLPILIGLRHLASHVFHAEEDGKSHLPAGAGTVFSVATVTVANGGDNIAAYIPLFGHQSASAIAVTCVVFAVMTSVWCAAGIALISHPRWGEVIRRGGHWIMPAVLIGLGVVILIR